MLVVSLLAWLLLVVGCLVMGLFGWWLFAADRFLCLGGIACLLVCGCVL